MELKDFVSTALSQLIDGVIEAQKYASQKNAYINIPFIPSSVSKDINIGFDISGHMIQIIEFDVAVTTNDSEQHEGKGGIDIQVVKAGYTGNSTISSSEVTRMKFSIPILIKPNTN